MKVSICTTTARRGFVEHQAALIAAQVRPDFDVEWVLVDFVYEERAAVMQQLATDLKLYIKHVPNVRDGAKFFRDITRNRNLALALAHATGDYLIFLDDYAIIAPDFIQEHLKIMAQGAISAGNMYLLEQRVDDLPTLVQQDFNTILEGYAVSIGQDHRAAYKTGGVSQPYIASGITYTGNVGFPRMICDHLNGYDSRMESMLEDCDFGYRATMAGFTTYFNPTASTINLHTTHIPYTFSFDHGHDCEPFVKNGFNNFKGDDTLKENEFITVEFKEHYRVAHCKRCGAQAMIDPNELIKHKLAAQQFRVPAGLPGGLDTLCKAIKGA